MAKCLKRSTRRWRKRRRAPYLACSGYPLLVGGGGSGVV